MKAKPNRWRPAILPDEYPKKLKQDLSEIDAQVESMTRHEPVPDDAPPPSDADPPP